MSFISENRIDFHAFLPKFVLVYLIFLIYVKSIIADDVNPVFKMLLDAFIIICEA